MRLRVTLVMPNYNHAAYLPSSLAAILNQHRPADEIILIDDASTDTSLAVIEPLIAGRPNVRLLRSPSNAGVVASLNRGLELATGDLVAFLGADDRIGPDFVATLAGALENAPGAAFACGRAAIQDHADRRTGTRPIVRPAKTITHLLTRRCTQSFRVCR